MSNALAVIQSQELLSPKDIEILKNSKFKNFEPAEIEYCSKVCNTLKLSPFLNQIHFVKRKNKDGTYAIAAQVGIDGFRLSAQRAGGYAGSDKPIYDYAPTDTMKKRPLKAEVTVYRMVDGTRCPFTGEARWEEFYNPVGGMWDKLPHQMIAKCAEAQALRKAFPAELSGIYAPEEMAQADGPTKAQDLQSAILPKPQEPTPSQSAPQSSERASDCPYCGSTNIMVSKYRENTLYCRGCKKESPMFITEAAGA